MKLLAKVIIVIAVFIAGFYFGGQQALSPSNGSPETKPTVPGEIQASLMLDFGNGEVRTFNQVPLTKEATVFELLEKVTAENNLEFGYKDYGGELGALIESINNVASDAAADRFWHYWVNNVFAEIGASNYQLKDGDIVEWKYMQNQFNLITN